MNKDLEKAIETYEIKMKNKKIILKLFSDHVIEEIYQPIDTKKESNKIYNGSFNMNPKQIYEKVKNDYNLEFDKEYFHNNYYK